MRKQFEISVREVCGTRITTRDDGYLISNVLKMYWDENDEIIIDFNNITIASVSFLDQAIGVFALEKELTEVRTKLQYLNISSFDRRLLEDILISRAMQRSKKQKASARTYKTTRANTRSKSKKYKLGRAKPKTKKTRARVMPSKKQPRGKKAASR